MTSYSLGAVKPWVADAANQLGNRFGIKTIGGVRPDSLPDHPSGHALDFMINNIPGGTDIGNRLADYAWANRDALALSYVIWNRRVISRKHPTTWEPYTQPGQPPHTDHVHMTFLDHGPGGGGGLALPGVIGLPGQTTVPGLGNIPVPDTLVGAVNAAADAVRTVGSGAAAIGDLAKKAMWLALPSTIVRIGAGIAGCALILIGVISLGKASRG